MAVPQPLGGDAGQQVGGEVGEAARRGRPRGARSGPAASIRRCIDAGGVLERLALQQPGQQQVPLLPEGQLLLDLDVIAAGQQPAGLQLEQHGRDEQELGGHLEVEGGPHLLEVGHVGVDDVRQRHLLQVDLLPGDEVQQQVERALEDGRAHRVGHTSTIPAGPFGPRAYHEPDDQSALGHPAHRRYPPRQLPRGACAGGWRTSTRATASTASSTSTPSPCPAIPTKLRRATLTMATLLLAAGLDPEACTLFVQSHVPAHTQLTWLLECTASMGELRRMTQFKDKAAGRARSRPGSGSSPTRC